MSRSPFMHSNFFSSLKQAEKRLKLENPSSTNDPTSIPSMPPLPILPVQPSSSSYAQGFTMTESLSSPIYLLNWEHQAKQSSTLGDSELPCEFLSVSHKFSTTQDDSIPQPQSPENQPHMLDEPEDDNDDIQLLMQLLHLSSFKEDPVKSEDPTGVVSEMNGGRNNDENHCCDDEFYAKVVGMKGPKCPREVERLEGWIRHLDNGGGEKTSEPLRLAHLLLAKAASVSEEENGTRGLEFPSTIEDFLLNDPPSD